MSSILEGLKPAGVFQYFEELTRIPHGSRNTKAISNYCVEFAAAHKLEYIQDELNNVIIKKKASKGMENHAAVILQGHLDMVNEKKRDSKHDFSKDPLSLLIDGDLLRCADTTLGGDDGIAIAITLAILADDEIVHPPIEAVFTVDEEIGLLGAQGLDITPLEGKYLLNIDSEEEGIFLAGCAGGVTAEITLPVFCTKEKGKIYQIEISGLNGGHSGTDIDKGVANAHKILGRFLLEFKNKGVDFGIRSISGGSKDNVIPSYCRIEIILPESVKNQNLIPDILYKLNSELQKEYKIADPNLHIEMKTGEPAEEAEYEVFSKKTGDILTFLLVNLPNGIQYMSQDIKGLVETSLNMGILNADREEIRIGYSIRSSVGSAKKALMEQLKYFAEFVGGNCHFSGEYPAWEYKNDSKLRELFLKVYQQMYHKDAEVQIIHAGLECGIFAEKFEKAGKTVDIISFGPDIADIHTVKEAMSISSVERVWNFILEVLKQL